MGDVQLPAYQNCITFIVFVTLSYWASSLFNFNFCCKAFFFI